MYTSERFITQFRFDSIYGHEMNTMVASGFHWPESNPAATPEKDPSPSVAMLLQRLHHFYLLGRTVYFRYFN